MTAIPQLKILFLEDDEDTRELVDFTLQRAGMSVVHAETCREAWELARKEKFDLFLLDCKLPYGDSLQLCRDLRELEPEKTIVFYTGLAPNENIRNGFEAGADDYIVKPFFGDLAERLLKAVERRTHAMQSPPDHSKVFQRVNDADSGTEVWETVNDESWKKYLRRPKNKPAEDLETAETGQGDPA